MTKDNILLEPGSLWNKIVEQTEYARQCGALQSIETDYQFIEHNGISFLVRTLSNLARKEKAQQQRKQQQKLTGESLAPETLEGLSLDSNSRARTPRLFDKSASPGETSSVYDREGCAGDPHISALDSRSTWGDTPVPTTDDTSATDWLPKTGLSRNRSVTVTNQEFDPFLPYEQDLFVADISPTHLCLLNKFNVVDHHLLVVTRDFEDQENWLNLADFQALWVCMQEIDGLAFYNGGKIAGASQRHKHLQLIPLPFIPEKCHLPIKPAIANAIFNDSIGTIPQFPFRHAIALLNLPESDTTTEAAQKMLACYYSLLRAVGLDLDSSSQVQTGAYNLLATKEWMLIVPRSQESFSSISINSLGFAGSLFVRDREQIKLLKEITPMTILSKVAFLKN